MDVGYIFAGSGTQYPGMSERLYLESPVYRQAFLRVARELDEILPVPLEHSVFSELEPCVLEEHPVMSCSNFAIQMALVDYWEANGVRPFSILTHSSGCHAAAYAAGAITFEEACEILKLRCNALSELPNNGGMAVAYAPLAQVLGFIRQLGLKIEVAAVNGPRWVTLTGCRSVLQEAVDAFLSEGISARMHRISHAFHSSLLDPILNSYRSALDPYGVRECDVPLYSTSSGRVERIGSEFWVSQIRGSMNFEMAFQEFRTNHGVSAFLEIGPDRAFMRFVDRLVPGEGTLRLASLSSVDISVTENSVDAITKRGMNNNA